MPNPKRLLQLFAVLAATLLIAILGTPILLVLTRGEAARQSLAIGAASTSSKLAVANLARPFALPYDSSITPLMAGEAMHSLRKFKDRDVPHFQFRMDVDAVEPQWLTDTYRDSLFPTAMPREWRGPSSLAILDAVAAGTTPEQRAYLDRIASDPVWTSWDRVARAPAVDVLAGQFVIPFSETATWYRMPIPKFASTKEYAYASISRAAAHLAAGRPDSAEHALRSTIGFGFAMVDNGVSLIEQLIGVVIVNIGRTALTNLYTITNDPRAVALSAAVDSVTALSKTADAARPPLRAMAAEEAMMISVLPCANLRELLGGISTEHQAKIDSLRAGFVRYPSEDAMFDLIEASLERSTGEDLGRDRSQYPTLTKLLSQFSNVAGRLTGNPRIGPCAELLLIPLG